MAVIQINDHFNGTSIKAVPGDIVELRLEETPVTGYRWQIIHADAGLVQLQSDEFTLQAAAIGGGGIRTFRFTVTGTGKGVLQLANQQPWSGDVYQSFQLHFC